MFNNTPQMYCPVCMKETPHTSRTNPTYDKAHETIGLNFEGGHPERENLVPHQDVVIDYYCNKCNNLTDSTVLS